MRKIFAVIAVLLVCGTRLMAQAPSAYSINVNNLDSIKPNFKPSRDFVMLQFGYADWTIRPDTVDLKKFSYKFSAYLCYDFPIKKSNFSFATGLGISTTSMYLDKQQLAVSDTGKNGFDASFVKDTANYKRYKYNTAYLTAPFELRYFANKYNRNKGFKAAIGMQVGTLLGAHTKGLRSVEGTNIREKINTKRYLSPWNACGTVRLGWGNFSVYGSYNITNVFKDNSGPPLTPLSVGICLTGL